MMHPHTLVDCTYFLNKLMRMLSPKKPVSLLHDEMMFRVFMIPDHRPGDWMRLNLDSGRRLASAP